MTSDIEIPLDKIKDGLIIAKDYAEYFLKMSKKLDNEKEFQLSIPCAILAFEEASKAEHFYKKIKDKEEIDENEWKDIRKHDFKLTDTEKQAKQKIETNHELAILVQSAILQGVGLKSTVPDKETAIAFKKKQIETYSKFSKIKERCFYADWNSFKKGWSNFQKIPMHEKKAFSTYIIGIVEHKLLLTKLSLEVLENPFREITDEEVFSPEKSKEYLKAKLEHHEKFESIKEMKEYENKIDQMDEAEFILGEKVLRKYFSN